MRRAPPTSLNIHKNVAPLHGQLPRFSAATALKHTATSAISRRTTRRSNIAMRLLRSPLAYLELAHAPSLVLSTRIFPPPRLAYNQLPPALNWRQQRAAGWAAHFRWASFLCRARHSITIPPARVAYHAAPSHLATSRATTRLLAVRGVRYAAERLFFIYRLSFRLPRQRTGNDGGRERPRSHWRIPRDLRWHYALLYSLFGAYRRATAFNTQRTHAWRGLCGMDRTGDRHGL